MKTRLEFQADRIEAILNLHSINARVTGGTVTPRWIRFLTVPADGTRINKITGLNEELAAALDVPNCRISRRGAALAIEVPRDDPKPVRLLPLYHQLINQPTTQLTIPPITAILGLAEEGAPILVRLPSPDVAHVLVAGTTGSGKTVLLQTMILSLALLNRPTDLALVLIDPKAHAFRPFSRLPHLARPTVTDPAEIATILDDLLRLMDHRTNCPTNQLPNQPTIVVVIDELADLLIVGGKDVQQTLTRLTQRGREAGIHIIAATQKPTAEVIGPLVKANFPVRLVGRVTSIEDARTASGWSGTGAERLTGRGDFLAVAEGRVTRFQAAHVTPAEIRQQVSLITAPPVPIAWPAPEEDDEPNPDDDLAHQLIASDLWPDRHGGNDGNYRRGFLSSACSLLFDQPLAGVHYTHTKTVLDLAESLAEANSTSTTTAETPQNQPANQPTVSPPGSSRKEKDTWVHFNCRTQELPKLSRVPRIIKPDRDRHLHTSLRLRASAALRSSHPLDIAPDRALLVGTTIGFVAGFAVKTLIQLIGGLL